ncbi:MAG TPA: ATP-binding protein [Kofleriaceae bacterium]|jgi:two-component system sensor histidine kinase RegB|nr:ATP-binding protein [Kofleriaceae bacterium]
MALLAAIPDRNWVNIQWLARLRWAEIAGQAATVLVGQFLLDGALPMAALLAVIAIGLVSNLAIELYYFGDRRRAGVVARPVNERQIALVMMLDIAVLTGLLYFSGGPHNPFAFLYVVQIALATVLVRALWSWMLVALSFIGFGILLIAHQPLTIPDSRRMIGAWMALGVASAFVVHFLRRIMVALAERDAELTEARGLAARQERLASLATMAAGAAHELSTPLSTVALAAKELERALTRDEASSEASRAGRSELAADARLIREQVGRCREILEQMAQGAGTVGEGVAPCTIDELLDEALVSARSAPPVHREVPPELAQIRLRLPPRAVSQALRSLITNAQDASLPTSAVMIAVKSEAAQLELAIRDRGAGMPDEILARIGEPFFTTKPPGRGMGLGLFLARAVLEAVGGSLDIESVAGSGTCVRVTLPIDVAQGAVPVKRSRESNPPGMVSKPA